jgi:hypothetical protein
MPIQRGLTEEYSRELPPETDTISGSKGQSETKIRPRHRYIIVGGCSLAYKFDHMPTLVPEDLIDPSNHLLGLQTFASSPHIFLFLKKV